MTTSTRTRSAWAPHREDASRRGPFHPDVLGDSPRLLDGAARIEGRPDVGQEQVAGSGAQGRLGCLAGGEVDRRSGQPLLVADFAEHQVAALGEAGQVGPRTGIGRVGEDTLVRLEAHRQAVVGMVGAEEAHAQTRQLDLVAGTDRMEVEGLLEALHRLRRVSQQEGHPLPHLARTVETLLEDVRLVEPQGDLESVEVGAVVRMDVADQHRVDPGEVLDPLQRAEGAVSGIEPKTRPGVLQQEAAGRVVRAGIAPGAAENCQTHSRTEGKYTSKALSLSNDFSAGLDWHSLCTYRLIAVTGI